MGFGDFLSYISTGTTQEEDERKRREEEQNRLLVEQQIRAAGLANIAEERKQSRDQQAGNLLSQIGKERGAMGTLGQIDLSKMQTIDEPPEWKTTDFSKPGAFGAAGSDLIQIEAPAEPVPGYDPAAAQRLGDIAKIKTPQDEMAFYNRELAPVADTSVAKEFFGTLGDRYTRETVSADQSETTRRSGEDNQAALERQRAADQAALERTRYQEDQANYRAGLALKAAANKASAREVDDVDIDYLAGEVAGGRIVPSDLRSYLPAGLVGGKARAETLRRASEIYANDHPGEDPLNASRLSRDYATFRSANTNKALVAVETFLPNLDKLQRAIEQLPANAPLRSLNTLLQQGQIEFGGQAATNVNMLKGVLAHELGASLGGGTALSDERIRIAMNSLNANAPREAALKSLDMLRGLEVNRHVNVAMQGGVYGENYLRDFYGDDTANALMDEERAARRKVGATVAGARHEKAGGGEGNEKTAGGGFVVGRVYTDAAGNRAEYQADGTWKEVP